MKIKCPLCKEKLDVKTHHDIAEHIWDFHKWENITIGEYSRLIFKIHELIEELERQDNFLSKTGILTLKSLLENENND